MPSIAVTFHPLTICQPGDRNPLGGTEQDDAFNHLASEAPTGRALPGTRVPSPRAVVLNLWVSIPWQGINQLENTDICTTIRDSSKITVQSSDENTSMVGSQHSMRKCIKGSQR